MALVVYNEKSDIPLPSEAWNLVRKTDVYTSRFNK